jgi:hypothetical protein
VQPLVQPDDGIQPLLKAIHRARRTIDLPIFESDWAKARGKRREAAERPLRALRASRSTHERLEVWP